MIAIYLLLAGIVGTSAVVAWHALGDRHSIEHYHKTMEALAETARRSPGQLRPGAPPANEGLESHPTPALGRDRLVFGDELGDDEPRNIPAIPPAGMGRGRRVARTARLRLSRFIAAAVLAVLVGSVLAVLLLGTGRTSPGGGHPARHASQARPVPVAGGSGSRSDPSGTLSSTSTTTTTTAAAAVSTGGPLISALVPSTGAAGQTLSVTGSQLFSANGVITVTFDGHVVATRCPSEERCIVTVPSDVAGATSAAVRVRTAVGQSNALTFRYASVGGQSRP